MLALSNISKTSYTQEVLERDLALTAQHAGIYGGPIPIKDPRIGSTLMELFMGLPHSTPSVLLTVARR